MYLPVSDRHVTDAGVSDVAHSEGNTEPLVRVSGQKVRPGGEHEKRSASTQSAQFDIHLKGDHS
nr:hypothetical protein StreXyl84_71520 [Streptomyces sp. Xyl84]